MGKSNSCLNELSVYACLLQVQVNQRCHNRLTELAAATTPYNLCEH